MVWSSFTQSCSGLLSTVSYVDLYVSASKSPLFTVFGLYMKIAETGRKASTEELVEIADAHPKHEAVACSEVLTCIHRQGCI